MTHSILPPSSANQWVQCAGSVTLKMGIDTADTAATLEGTAAHWVCEQILESYRSNDVSVIIDSDLKGVIAPNGVAITDEMIECGNEYTRDILRVCNVRGLLSDLRIEQRVNMPDIHDECFGTPDCYAFDAGENTLYIWDYKFGHGRIDAYENWQMICYALGCLNQITNGQALQDFGIKVVTRIVQPRCYDGKALVQEWCFDAISLRGYVNLLNSAAEDAMLGGHTRTGLHCKHCDAAILCPALRDAGAGIVDRTGDASPAAPTAKLLDWELTQLELATVLIKQRREALEIEAEHRIIKGEVIPNRALEQGYGKNKWSLPMLDVSTMGTLLGVDLIADRALVTPAEAKRRLKKLELDVTLLDGHYAKPKTKMKLISTGNKARAAFSKG